MDMLDHFERFVNYQQRIVASCKLIRDANEENIKIVQQNLHVLQTAMSQGQFFEKKNALALGQVISHQFFQPFQSKYDFTNAALKPFFPIKNFALQYCLWFYPRVSLLILFAHPIMKALEGIFHGLTFNFREAKESFIASSSLFLKIFPSIISTLLKTVVDLMTLITRSLTTIISLAIHNIREKNIMGLSSTMESAKGIAREKLEIPMSNSLKLA